MLIHFLQVIVYSIKKPFGVPESFPVAGFTTLGDYKIAESRLAANIITNRALRNRLLRSELPVNCKHDLNCLERAIRISLAVQKKRGEDVCSTSWKTPVSYFEFDL